MGSVCAALALFAVGCDQHAPHEVPARPATTGNLGATGQPYPTGVHVDDKPRQDRTAGVGDRLTLDRPGAPDTELMTAVNAVIREARTEPAGSAPVPGRRWDAVNVTVTNTGWDAYRGGIADAFTLLDTGGHAYPASDPQGRLTVGEPLTRDGTLQVGQRARGWIVFSLPTDATPAHLRFRWDDGAVDDDTVWKL